MDTPIVRVNSGPLEAESINEIVQIPELNPEAAKKGIDYENLGILLRSYSYLHHDTNYTFFWSCGLLKRILTKERIVEELDGYRRKFPWFRNQDLPSLAENILRSGGVNDNGLRGGGRTSQYQLIPSDSRLKGEVRNGYLNIFAILLLLNKGFLIGTFIEERICDNDLPLANCRTTPVWASMLSRKSAPEHPLDCFSDWDIDKREMFARWQHVLDIVYLGLSSNGNIQHRQLGPKAVFPWISYKSKQNGGYGCVYHAVAPPDCHEFTKVLSAIVFNNCFAVKELKQRNEPKMKEEEMHFWKEVDMLKRFSGVFHEHLVTLLMTWSIQDRHYFLFPWAPCDLDLYWENGNNWSLDKRTQCIELETMRWISKQILGLTEALHQIHVPKHLADAKFGRHGDLKPENILWYESPKDPKGILVIADFGLGSFNSAKSRSNIPGEAIPVTPNYRPPECDLEGGMISRSFDIWTFGCLLLELTCWAFGGKELRENFEVARDTLYITGSKTDIFFDVERQEGSTEYVIKRKQTVTEWITDLHSHRCCTQYFHDLLDIIEDRMLIVLTPTQNRIECSELVKMIWPMHAKVMDNNSIYSGKPCPEKRDLKPNVAFRAQLNDTAKGNIKTHKPEGLSVHRGEVRASKSPDQLRALAR